MMLNRLDFAGSTRHLTPPTASKERAARCAYSVRRISASVEKMVPGIMAKPAFS